MTTTQMARASTRGGAPFVLDAVEEFLRTKLPREPKTYASYQTILLGTERGTKPALGTPLASHFQNRRFNTVTHDEIAAWFAQRVNGGAQDTKNRISKGARSFFTFAHDRGHTGENLGTVIERFRPGGPRVDWLEWPESHRLITAIPEFRYRLAASWLFLTGCRVSEACAARQEDVRWRSEVNLYQWTIPDSKTHAPRSVWLPDALAEYVNASRELNKPNPSSPVLWDCSGRGFGRVEDPASAISPRVINGALERGREAANLPVRITAHIAKHSYCTNWVQEFGSGELAMEKLSRQVGTSVTVLRRTYVHFDLNTADWAHIKTLGAQGGTTIAA